MLAPGSPVPDFSLPTPGGSTVARAALAGRAYVLYFYPKADTSGCTQEAQDFTRLAGEFEALSVPVIGVSGDSVKALDKFKTKYELGVELASATEELFAQFGVWVEKSMYGKKYMGLERATFLVDGQGTVVEAWRKVKVTGHAEAVLAAAKALVARTPA